MRSTAAGCAALMTMSKTAAEVATIEAERKDMEIDIKRNGSRPAAKGSPDWFTGPVRVEPLFQAPDPARASAGQVTFEPGARTNWHTHPLGQTLIITSGLGWVQRDGGPIQEVRPGDVVWFPPGLKHWHGAAPTTAMTHIAIQETLDGKNVDWMEKVSDEQYESEVMKWSNDDLGKIGSNDDLHVSPFRSDGKTHGTPTWIWSVVVDGALYARAYNGRQSRWHQAAITQKAGRITSAGLTKDVVFETVSGAINDRIDEAYRLKYRTSPYLEAMIGERARSATVEILPRSKAASNGE